MNKDIVRHSNFLKQTIRINKERNSIESIHKHSELSFPEVTMPYMSAQNVNIGKVDSRFNSNKFRQDVRIVLNYIGLESNMGNFKKYDKKHGSETPIDWAAFAGGIRCPKHTAVVELLYPGKTTGKTVCLDLPRVDKNEAIKNLDTKVYKFIRWW